MSGLNCWSQDNRRRHRRRGNVAGVEQVQGTVVMRLPYKFKAFMPGIRLKELLLVFLVILFANCSKNNPESQSTEEGGEKLYSFSGSQAFNFHYIEDTLVILMHDSSVVKRFSCDTLTDSIIVVAFMSGALPETGDGPYLNHYFISTTLFLWTTLIKMDNTDTSLHDFHSTPIRKQLWSPGPFIGIDTLYLLMPANKTIFVSHNSNL